MLSKVASFFRKKSSSKENLVVKDEPEKETTKAPAFTYQDMLRLIRAGQIGQSCFLELKKVIDAFLCCMRHQLSVLFFFIVLWIFP
jgi:hypothetical protein